MTQKERKHMTILEHIRARAMQGDKGCQGILDSWGKTNMKDNSNAVHRYVQEHGLPNLPPIAEEHIEEPDEMDDIDRQYEINEKMRTLIPAELAGRKEVIHSGEGDTSPMQSSPSSKAGGQSGRATPPVGWTAEKQAKLDRARELLRAMR